jgi:hypothetical protein
MRPDFEILAAKVLAGEASFQERAALDDLLAKHPEFATDLQELQQASRVFREAGHITEALNAPPCAVPPERMSEFQELVSRKFSSPARCNRSKRPALFTIFRLASAGLALLAIAAAAWFVQLWKAPDDQETVAFLVLERGTAELLTRDGRQPIALTTPVTAEASLILAPLSRAFAITQARIFALEGATKLSGAELSRIGEQNATATRTVPDALFVSETNLAGLLVANRAGSGLAVYSPLGATASLRPLFFWKAEQGKTYDVRITDALADATRVWQAEAVVPPLEFDRAPGWKERPLFANNLYRVEIAVTGEPGSGAVYTFRTTENAPQELPVTDAAKLLEACNLLSGRSGRLGDALADLLTLGTVAAESDLALRLKLLAFGEAGLREEFQRIAAKLVQRPSGEAF